MSVKYAKEKDNTGLSYIEVMSGTPDGQLLPGVNASRAEAATMLLNLMSRMEE